MSCLEERMLNENIFELIWEEKDTECRIDAIKIILKAKGIDAVFKDSPSSGNPCLVLKDKDNNYFAEYKNMYKILYDDIDNEYVPEEENDLSNLNGIVKLLIIGKSIYEHDYFGRIEEYDNSLVLLDVESFTKLLKRGTGVVYKDQIYFVSGNDIDNTNEDMSDLNYILSETNDMDNTCYDMVHYTEVEEIKGFNINSNTNGNIIKQDEIEKQSIETKEVVRLTRSDITPMLKNIGINPQNIIYEEYEDKEYNYSVKLALDGNEHTTISLANFIKGAKGVYADYTNALCYMVEF